MLLCVRVCNLITCKRKTDLTTVRADGTARSASCHDTRLRTWWRGWHDDPVTTSTLHSISSTNYLLRLLQRGESSEILGTISQQGNRRYQTSPVVCNRTINSIYFLHLSPINAQLTSLSYVHQYIYLFLRQHSNNDNGVVRFCNYSH